MVGQKAMEQRARGQKAKIRKKNSTRSKSAKRGRGLINDVIDFLPFELHLPSYNYCGPGTKLEKRLARGDKGINKLDEACKEHDIAYSKHKDSAERQKADLKLGGEAIKRVFSGDASLGERAASLLVSSMMGAKAGLSKLGMGISKCRKKPKKSDSKSKKPSEITMASLIKGTKRDMGSTRFMDPNSAAVFAIRTAEKKAKGKRVKMPRFLKVPEYSGGVLPILPILGGLVAVGGMGNSITGVVKTATDIRIAQKHLEENKHHNKNLELKVGNGLYLRPHSKGSGLYLNPLPKNY